MVRSAVDGGVAPPCFRSTKSHSISLQWQATSLHPPAATNANADLDCGEAMVISVYLVPQRSRSLPICLTSSNQSWNTGDVGLELWNRNNGKYCHPVSLPSHFHSNSLSEQVALILTSTMWWWDLLKTQSYFLLQHILYTLDIPVISLQKNS